MIRTHGWKRLIVWPREFPAFPSPPAFSARSAFHDRMLREGLGPVLFPLPPQLEGWCFRREAVGSPGAKDSDFEDAPDRVKTHPEAWRPFAIRLFVLPRSGQEAEALAYLMRALKGTAVEPNSRLQDEPWAGYDDYLGDDLGAWLGFYCLMAETYLTLLLAGKEISQWREPPRVFKQNRHMLCHIFGLDELQISDPADF